MKENKLHYQQEQVEKLEELGSRLRQFRTEQSIALEDVAERTRIQARLLNAIEEGRLDQLPEPVYVQGFIKRFAEELGLDGAEFAEAFPAGPAVPFPKPSWRYLPAAQLRPIHLYAIYVVLVIGAVSSLSLLVNRSEIQVKDLETTPEQSDLLPAPSASPKPNSQQQLELAESTAAAALGIDGKPVQVGITLTQQSWLRIVADGKTEFEGVLPEGTQRTWAADQQLTIRAGNAGGVLVKFNDESAQEMGQDGAVLEKTFASKPKS